MKLMGNMLANSGVAEVERLAVGLEMSLTFPQGLELDAVSGDHIERHNPDFGETPMRTPSVAGVGWVN